MYISNTFVTILAAASTAQAFQFSDVQEAASSAAVEARSLLSAIFNRQSACPAVWKEISTTLTAQFLGDGECTDAARAAIRAAFHDCFNGACDGSLILAGECSNNENRGLERLCGNLGNLANEKKVGVADLIQFAAGKCRHGIYLPNQRSTIILTWPQHTLSKPARVAQRFLSKSDVQTPAKRTQPASSQDLAKTPTT